MDHKGKGKYVEPAKPQDADEDDEEVDFDAEVGEHRCSHRKSSTKLCWGSLQASLFISSLCAGPHTPYLPLDIQVGHKAGAGCIHHTHLLLA